MGKIPSEICDLPAISQILKFQEQTEENFRQSFIDVSNKVDYKEIEDLHTLFSEQLNQIQLNFENSMNIIDRNSQTDIKTIKILDERINDVRSHLDEMNQILSVQTTENHQKVIILIKVVSGRMG